MLYNKKNMKMRYLSINQLSQVTGRDRATISKRLELLKPHEENGRAKIYDAHEAIPLLYSTEQAKGMQKKIEMVQYEIEKEKLNKLRLDNDAKIGRLVDISEVAKTVEKEYVFVRAQIRSMPARMSKVLSMESDPMVVNSLLAAEIDETLKELISDKKYEQQMKELEDQEDAKIQSVTTIIDSDKEADTNTPTED